MKIRLGLIALLMLTVASFAQRSEDLDLQHLDSLKAQLDTETMPDDPALMQVLDSLSGSGEAPADFGELMRSGQSDLSAGRIEQALAEFDRAVQMVPDDPRALTLQGQSLTLLGRTDEALPPLNKALSLNPGNAEARYHRAGAHNLMSNPEAALADLRAALIADSTLKYLAGSSPYFQSLRNNPQFQKLVK
jgi:Flp pilus assembly protein TadD